jgi:hypothetical protein
MRWLGKDSGTRGLLEDGDKEVDEKDVEEYQVNDVDNYAENGSY